MLVVSIGNTNARFGWFDGADPIAIEAISTASLKAIPPLLAEGWGASIVSVVPEATEALRGAWGDRELRVLDADSSGLTVDYHPARSMGADRIANAIALLDRGLVPGIAVDCGTATTLTVVDARGHVVGGAIAPGLGTAARALVGKTAQLRHVPYVRKPEPWGQDTLSSLQLGMVEGHIGMIAHLVARMRRGLDAEAPAVLCGGWSETLHEGLPGFICAPFLTLEGG
ncbi:MAG TPA: type III pantothenate kinase, partial [Pantanalinema sp.]